MPVIRSPYKNFAAKQAAATSPMVSKALFLCRGRNGLDQVCVGALAIALAIRPGHLQAARRSYIRGQPGPPDQLKDQTAIWS